MGLAAPALEAHNLYRFFHAGDDEALALKGVSLTIEPGETVAVMGPSGSGKSTLVNCLAGLDEPDGGWVAVGGQRMTRRPQAEQTRLRARHIGLLLQSGNFLDHLTIAGNLQAGMRFAAQRPDRAAIAAALSAVGLTGRGNAFSDQLSGGELARAGLALALINQPELMLVDEPTGEVDAANEKMVLQLIVDRAHGGCATLIVTHSAAVASTADRVLHLVDGQLSEQ